MKKYELLNSEGSILVLSTDKNRYIMNFTHEKLTWEINETTAYKFVNGEINIKSPSGKSYDLFPNGEWKGMIQHSQIISFLNSFMSENMANRIYNVLVEYGGAYEGDRNNFVYHHTKNGCDEWRFQGKLGFGGKYRSGRNTVDCYKEDLTPEIQKNIDQINKELSKLK